MKFNAFRFGSPSPMVEKWGEMYAVFPYTLELTLPNGAPGSQPAYLICISSDRGATWTFLDGAGVGADRAKLKRFLPDFPDTLPLPALDPLSVQP